MEDNRTIKFKTLDNEVSEMTVAKNISIAELKKLIHQKKQMPVEAQRLIFQGKQMKDNQLLSDHITQDNEIIHLMCKTPEQMSTQSQESQQQPQQPNPQLNQQQASINGAPMLSFIGNMLNPTNIMQMTNMIFGENGQNLNIINNSMNQSMQSLNQPPSGNANDNQVQTSSQNTAQSQLHPPAQLQPQTQSQPQPQPQPQTDTTSQPEEPRRIVNPLCLYPINSSEADVRYNNFLNGINKTLDVFSKEMNPNEDSTSNHFPPLPTLNTTQNVLTAISRSLRYYHLSMSQFLPLLGRLIDLLEREQFIVNAEDRKKNNELLKKCASAFESIGKSSTSFNCLLKETSFGNAPNTGYVNVTSRNVQGIINESQRASSTASNQQPSTGQSTNPPAQENIFGDIMNQLLRPQNLANIVGMVQTMANNQNGNNSGNQAEQGSQGNQANSFGNLMSNIMNSIQVEYDVPDENMPGRTNSTSNANTTGQNQQTSQPQQQIQPQPEPHQQPPSSQPPPEKDTPKETLNKVLNDPSLKKTTHLGDIKEVIKITPHQDFASFSTQIVSHLTFHEISSLGEIDLSGLVRLRAPLCKLVSSSTKASLIAKLIELISERIILIENKADKLKPGQEFFVEPLLNAHIAKIIDILLNNALTVQEWESTLKKAFISFIKELFLLIATQYQSGHEGAMFCFAFNVEGLLTEIVGKEMISAFKAVNGDSIMNAVEHVADLAFSYKETEVKAEKAKIEEKQEKEVPQEKKVEPVKDLKPPTQPKEKPKESPKEQPKEKEDIPVQVGTVPIDMEEVFKVAMKDKSRLADNPQGEIKFSELYYRTSLFQE